MCFIKLVRKLYCHLNGSLFMYVVWCSFIIHQLCSTRPNLMVYFFYFSMYTAIKRNYFESRERLKLSLAEYEDIHLQREIVKTKICVIEAELRERGAPLRREVERLRAVRARVFELVSSEDAMRRLLRSAIDANPGDHLHCSSTRARDKLNAKFPTEFKNGLILKSDPLAASDKQPDHLDCGEYANENDPADDPRNYCTLNDLEVLPDCRIKIVKVTNIYKVAYLKHYIKQKRLRRANKHAILKKKMENVKKLLEDCQNTLNKVINSNLLISNADSQSIDVLSQEAMGDYSKPSDFSDSDTDIRNNDNFYDDYSRAKYENFSEASHEYYDRQSEFNHMVCSAYVQQCGYGARGAGIDTIPEETGSQVAIAEVASEASDDAECRDAVAI